jgi:hypothetical protein
MTANKNGQSVCLINKIAQIKPSAGAVTPHRKDGCMSKQLKLI